MYGDRHKLSQALRNILSNALKFTPNEGKIDVKVKILLSGKAEKSYSHNSSATSRRTFLGVKIAPEASSSYVDNSVSETSVPREVGFMPMADFMKHSLLCADNGVEADAVRVRIEIHDTGDGISNVSGIKIVYTVYSNADGVFIGLNYEAIL